MNRTIAAHFDGKVIVPDEPVDLAQGQQLRIRIEVADNRRNAFTDLADLAVDLPDAPPDLAHEHDHYLYGLPKKNDLAQ